MGKGGGILPVTIHNNKLYFLFGLDKDGWSDFGGSRENNEKPFQTAIREGCEELNGFLNSKTLKSYVRKHLIIDLDVNTYVSYLFYIPYNEYIEQYFNNNSYFMRSKLPHQVDKDGLLEKEKVKWFSLTTIKRNKKQFRKWYHIVLKQIIVNKDTIEERIKKYI